MAACEQLKIHTRPPEDAQSASKADLQTKRRSWVRRSKAEDGSDKKRSSRLSYGERLIRNSSVACAILLTLMAVRNIDTPWSNRLTQSVRSAVTMRVDWDNTIGRLSFVRALMPDAALVFMNLSDGEALQRPVEGSVRHAYSADQPWLEYACAPSSPVLAAMDGMVTAVGQGAGADYIVLITHEGGESVYGYLAETALQAGQRIAKGEEVGKSSERVYFEWREEGQSVDPGARLGS